MAPDQFIAAGERRRLTMCSINLSGQSLGDDAGQARGRCRQTVTALTLRAAGLSDNFTPALGTRSK